MNSTSTNTSNDDRKLDSYLTNGLQVSYIVPQKIFKEVSLHVTANNILDEEYENNAWVYSYYTGGNRYKNGWLLSTSRKKLYGKNYRLNSNPQKQNWTKRLSATATFFTS